MTGGPPCAICSEPLDGPVCANCGANVAKVEEALRDADRMVVPTFWQILWGRAAISSPSEALWEHLSPGFQDALLAEYQARQWRARAFTNGILLLVVWGLLASCFWGGVAAARAFGVGGGNAVLWLCGAAGMLVLLPVRVFPVGARVEELLLTGSREASAQAVLDRFPLVGEAVECRCRLPWYLNPDVLFPAVVTTVLVAGWFLL